MRDDDGNLIKNAHILGTIKVLAILFVSIESFLLNIHLDGQRILKLLFHKIRPIFVFDGATPVLKLRTIRNRRLIHERNVCNNFLSCFFPPYLTYLRVRTLTRESQLRNCCWQNSSSMRFLKS